MYRNAVKYQGRWLVPKSQAYQLFQDNDWKGLDAHLKACDARQADYEFRMGFSIQRVSDSTGKVSYQVAHDMVPLASGFPTQADAQAYIGSSRCRPDLVAWNKCWNQGKGSAEA